MFEKILVTLDGSQVSETAVYYAEELTGRLGSEIVLLHACPPDHQSFYRMHAVYLKDMASTMQREVKKKFPRCKECLVRSEVVFGEPAEVICDYVEKNDIKLVVMATQGGSGFKVWVLGSVVDKVLREIDVPILLIRAKGGRSAKAERSLVNRIILPLDGSDGGKISIPYAAELAKKLKASIKLFGMVEHPIYPSYGEGELAILKQEIKAGEKRMRDFIGEVETALRADGIPVKHLVKMGSDAGVEIIELGRKTEADLVVMATHVRSPLARWFLGSVAEKVLLEGDLPVLMVRKESN